VAVGFKDGTIIMLHMASNNILQVASSAFLFTTDAITLIQLAYDQSFYYCIFVSG
jgi:hypothetical protein